MANQFKQSVHIPIKLGIVPVSPFEQNCSILVCQETGDAAVIDPGGDIEKILDGAQHLGGSVKRILLTHGHLDYCAAAKDLSEQLGVPIEGPQVDEQFWLDQLPEQTIRFGFGHAKAFLPTRWLKDGDHVQVGNVDLEVFHCPGHTPGHVIFFDR